jgi:hypothetical protein
VNLVSRPVRSAEHVRRTAVLLREWPCNWFGRQVYVLPSRSRRSPPTALAPRTFTSLAIVVSAA